METIIHSEVGGFRKGMSYMLAWNGTIPFAFIQVYPRKIVFTYLFFFKNVFTPENVEYIEKYHGIFSPGVHIVHKIKGVSPFILFWSFSCNKLLDAIKSAGFIVR